MDFPAAPDASRCPQEPAEPAALGKREQLAQHFEASNKRTQEMESVKRQRRRADKEIKADEYKRVVAVILRRGREKKVPLESLVERMTNHKSCLGKGTAAVTKTKSEKSSRSWPRSTRTSRGSTT